MSGEPINLCPKQGENNKKLKINPKPIPPQRMLKVAPKNIHLAQKPTMNVLSHKLLTNTLQVIYREISALPSILHSKK